MCDSNGPAPAPGRNANAGVREMRRLLLAVAFVMAWSGPVEAQSCSNAYSECMALGRQAIEANENFIKGQADSQQKCIDKVTASFSAEKERKSRAAQAFMNCLKQQGSNCVAKLKENSPPPEVDAAYARCDSILSEKSQHVEMLKIRHNECLCSKGCSRYCQ